MMQTIDLDLYSDEPLISPVPLGDYANGDAKTLGIPLQTPLLVIRDPPGGSSTASYSRVETTIKVSVENYERYEGLDAGGAISGSFGGGTGACVGLGAEASAQTSSIEGSIGAHLDHSYSMLRDLKDDENSHGVSVVWSYATSADPEYAGQLSDSFLINTLSILFRETRTILFDEDSCSASEGDARITFDLKSEENRRPLTFVSYYQVKNELQPELERALSSKQAELRGLEAAAEAAAAEVAATNGASTSDDVREPTPEEQTLSNQIQIIESGLSAWEKILEDYDETNTQAKSNRLPFANDFFKQQAEKRPHCQQRPFKPDPDIVNDGSVRWQCGIEYRCTSKQDEWPSPHLVTPDITEICLDFSDRQKCLEQRPIVCIEGEDDEWKDLPASHAYYKVSDSFKE